MKVIPINTIEGICRTILSTYYKIGTYNVFEHDFPAIMEINELKENKKGLWYMGRFIPVWSGLYDNMTIEFFRGALPGLSRTLKCDDSASVCVEQLNDKEMAKVYRIRKLTPLECMRLMGVKDEDTQKMKDAGISDSQLYKMAGNSIVVNVLEGIFTQMFRKDTECLF